MSTMYERMTELEREVQALRIRMELVERLLTSQPADSLIFEERFKDGQPNEHGTT